MVVTKAISEITGKVGHALVFSGHYAGGAVRTSSVSINDGAPMAITSANPAVLNLPLGKYKCSLDFVVESKSGALNRHYGIMIDVNGFTLATAVGDIPVGSPGDFGHASYLLTVTS